MQTLVLLSVYFSVAFAAQAMNQDVRAVPLVGNQLSNGAIPGSTPEAYAQAVIDSQLPPPPLVPEWADTIFPLIGFDFVIRGNMIIEIDAIYLSDADMQKIITNPNGVKIRPIAVVNPDRSVLTYPEEQYGSDLRSAIAYLLRDYTRVEAFGQSYTLIEFDYTILTWEDFVSAQSLENILNEWVAQAGLPPKNFIIVEGDGARMKREEN